MSTSSPPVQAQSLAPCRLQLPCTSCVLHLLPSHDSCRTLTRIPRPPERLRSQQPLSGFDHFTHQQLECAPRNERIGSYNKRLGCQQCTRLVPSKSVPSSPAPPRRLRKQPARPGRGAYRVSSSAAPLRSGRPSTAAMR